MHLPRLSANVHLASRILCLIMIRLNLIIVHYYHLIRRNVAPHPWAVYFLAREQKGGVEMSLSVVPIEYFIDSLLHLIN